jgi:hypothetical protein
MSSRLGRYFVMTKVMMAKVVVGVMVLVGMGTVVRECGAPVEVRDGVEVGEPKDSDADIIYDKPSEP